MKDFPYVNNGTICLVILNRQRQFEIRYTNNMVISNYQLYTALLQTHVEPIVSYFLTLKVPMHTSIVHFEYLIESTPVDSFTFSRRI